MKKNNIKMALLAIAVASVPINSHALGEFNPEGSLEDNVLYVTTAALECEDSFKGEGYSAEMTIIEAQQNTAKACTVLVYGRDILRKYGIIKWAMDMTDEELAENDTAVLAKYIHLVAQRLGRQAWGME